MNSELMDLILILVVSCAVLGYGITQESVWNDESVYMWLGEKLSENPFFLLEAHLARTSFTYTPILLIAFFNLFLKNPFLSARLASFTFSVLEVVVMYFFGKKLFGRYGGICTAFLTLSSPIYLFLSKRALTDIPSTFFMTLTMFFLYKMLENGKKFSTLAGISLFLTLFTKISAFPFIAVATFSGVFFNVNKLKDKKLLIFLGITLLSLLLYFSINFHFFNRPFYRPAGRFLKPGVLGGSPTLYLKSAGIIYNWLIFLLALLGIYLGMDKKEILPLAFWFLFYFLLLSFFIGEKVPRYALPTLPPAVLLAVYSSKELINKFKVPKKTIFILLIIGIHGINVGFDLYNMKKLTYTGFTEVGEKIKNMDEIYNFSIIYAQSQRQIRAFSGIEYKSEGGKIEPLPKNLGELSNKKKILLQLDVWEYTAPEWAYPLTQEKLNKILEQNFTLAHVVYREVLTQNGLQKIPVGFILVKI